MPVTAVTVWSLLGAYDWHRLLVADVGFYESGVFDVRATPPRPTALAPLVQRLAAGRAYRHPVLEASGWWRRPESRIYGPSGTPRPAPSLARARRAPRRRQPLLITGGGTLGQALARICESRGLEHRLVRRTDVDIADAAAVGAALDGLRPWAVINAAGYVRVDDAETDVARCERENVRGPAVLAEACASRATRFVTYSSDLVFDGGLCRPYLESDPTTPLGVYGRTKAEAERAVLTRWPQALVVRTSAFFGPWDAYNFVVIALREIAARRPFRAAGDFLVSPTYVPDLVHATLDLLIDDAAAVWHLANRGGVSWAELARRAVMLAGLDPALVVECSGASLGWAAPRPAFSVLGSERGQLLPDLDDALARYMRDRLPDGDSAAA